MRQENGLINDQNDTDYGEGNQKGTTVKFETKVIESSLITGDITATVGNADTRVVFKSCAPLTKCIINHNMLILLKILILQCLCTV